MRRLVILALVGLVACGTSAARAPPKVGTPTGAAAYTLTVQAFQDPYTGPLAERTPPVADGMKRVGVEVTLENTRRQAVLYSLSFFKLKDQDGRDYRTPAEQYMLPDGVRFGGGTLAAGDKARGWIPFEVPATAKGLRLVYELSVVLLD